MTGKCSRRVSVRRVGLIFGGPISVGPAEIGSVHMCGWDTAQLWKLAGVLEFRIYSNYGYYTIYKAVNNIGATWSVCVSWSVPLLFAYGIRQVFWWLGSLYILKQSDWSVRHSIKTNKMICVPSEDSDQPSLSAWKSTGVAEPGLKLMSPWFAVRRPASCDIRSSEDLLIIRVLFFISEVICATSQAQDLPSCTDSRLPWTSVLLSTPVPYCPYERQWLQWLVHIGIVSSDIKKIICNYWSQVHQNRRSAARVTEVYLLFSGKGGILLTPF